MRAMVKRGVRRNITSDCSVRPGVVCFGQFRGIYKINATTGGDLRAKSWSLELWS